jgi:hypothetical protein
MRVKLSGWYETCHYGVVQFPGMRCLIIAISYVLFQIPQLEQHRPMLSCKLTQKSLDEKHIRLRCPPDRATFFYLQDYGYWRVYGVKS